MPPTPVTTLLARNPAAPPTPAAAALIAAVQPLGARLATAPIRATRIEVLREAEEVATTAERERLPEHPGTFMPARCTH